MITVTEARNAVKIYHQMQQLKESDVASSIRQRADTGNTSAQFNMDQLTEQMRTKLRDAGFTVKSDRGNVLIVSWEIPIIHTPETESK